MWFLLLFVLGALISFVLQRWLAIKAVALFVPGVMFIVCGLAYHGGSMWLLAIFFGLPVVFVGSVAGVLSAGKQLKK